VWQEEYSNVIKKFGIFGLLVALMLAVGVFAGSQNARAFPRGSVFRNITVNPGAIPSGGLATVTVSYLCEASGCFDKGGLGQLIVKPTGIFKQVSTCSYGALGNFTIPGSFACFDGPLSNDAIVNYGNQRLPTNQILVPPPEPASPELHTLQAIVEANAALPGTTLIICYQEEPVTSYLDPAIINGNLTAGIDIFSLITRSIPPGDPPVSAVSGASGVYASLCVFILVTSGSPQHITLLDVTSTNINIGGRVVVRALVTDQNGNPVPGVNVSFTVSDPSQASLTCTTTQDFVAVGYVFNALYAGSFPGPAGVPSAGATANPGAGIQAGQTSLGSPFPVNTASTTTLQATPLGYTCYSGTALGGATGLGTVPPGAVTSLTDGTGVAYVTLVGLASADRGAGVVVTATVFDGGIPPRGISARSTPFVIAGAHLQAINGTITVTPTSIASPSNTASVRACYASTTGLPVPQGTPIVFTIVEKQAGVLDAAFAQAQTGDQNQQVTRAAGSDGCATASIVATGSGAITVSVAVGSVVVTASIPVGTGDTSAGQTGIWTSTPSGTTSTCPGANSWLGAYWRGAKSPVATAIAACSNATRIWVRVSTTWYGYATDQTGASDSFDIENGMFAFLYGRP
jgi:hypothetical protein